MSVIINTITSVLRAVMLVILTIFVLITGSFLSGIPTSVGNELAYNMSVFLYMILAYVLLSPLFNNEIFYKFAQFEDKYFTILRFIFGIAATVIVYYLHVPLIYLIFLYLLFMILFKLFDIKKLSI